jgi:hypothetical protein
VAPPPFTGAMTTRFFSSMWPRRHGVNNNDSVTRRYSCRQGVGVKKVRTPYRQMSALTSRWPAAVALI